MKSFEIIRLWWMVLTLSVMLIGCAGKNNEAADGKDTLYVNESGVQEQDTTKGSGDWTELKFQLNGKELQLPFAASVLVENGWSACNAECDFDTFVVHPGKRTSWLEVYHDTHAPRYSQQVVLNFANYTNEEKLGTDCNICSLTVDIENGGSLTKQPLDLVLPGGITFGSTKEDIISEFGEPTTESLLKSTGNVRLQYNQDDYTYYMSFIIHNEYGVIEMQLQTNKNTLPDEEWHLVNKE